MSKSTAKNQHSLRLQPGTLLIVISGPSGVGKDATLNEMRRSGHNFHYVVTATTRPKRPVETDGKDYIFLSREKFQKMLSNDDFLEWAEVYEHYYGVPKKQIKQALNAGIDVVVKVDVQGANTIKRIVPDAVFIFLTPPSLEELAQRLKNRGNHTEEELSIRLGKAQMEMDCIPMFDYVVESYTDDLKKTVANILAIISAEKSRVIPRQIIL
jgi:guanylate kinase